MKPVSVELTEHSLSDVGWEDAPRDPAGNAAKIAYPPSMRSSTASSWACVTACAFSFDFFLVTLTTSLPRVFASVDSPGYKTDKLPLAGADVNRSVVLKTWAVDKKTGKPDGDPVYWKVDVVAKPGSTPQIKAAEISEADYQTWIKQLRKK